MPNIQICGFFPAVFLGDAYSWVHEEQKVKAFEVRGKINHVMQDAGYGEDAITEIILSTAISCNGKNKLMPYLRICDTDPRRLEQIVQALKEANIGMDVETLLLSGFVEAKDMKT